MESCLRPKCALTVAKPISTGFLTISRFSTFLMFACVLYVGLLSFCTKLFSSYRRTNWCRRFFRRRSIGAGWAGAEDAGALRVCVGSIFGKICARERPWQVTEVLSVWFGGAGGGSSLNGATKSEFSFAFSYVLR